MKPTSQEDCIKMQSGDLSTPIPDRSLERICCWLRRSIGIIQFGHYYVLVGGVLIEKKRFLSVLEITYRQCIVTSPHLGMGEKYCDQRVCMSVCGCVCLSADISEKPQSKLHEIFYTRYLWS